MADIASLAADIKETNRLLKILDEYATSEAKRLSTELIAARNDIKALEKKVADLEKKQKK
jgi:polyhydroxyalkanoate synthesis regulator phasin